MNFFEKKVLNTIENYSMINKGDKIVVGLSGGADSTVLVNVLKKLSGIFGFEIAVAHINHLIRGDEATRDMNFAKDIADNLNVPFFSKIVDVPKYAKENHISEELAGRKIRYDFFEEICKKHKFTKIAVAHNQNDSAETVIINLVRGCAGNGLGGILPVNGSIIRPLINISRKNIEEYADEHNITYITDSTNKENIYTRNIIRNIIFPELENINNGTVNNIVRCSEIISSENDFLEQHIKELNIIKKCNQETFIDKKSFNSLHIALKRRVVIECIRSLSNSTQNISATHIQAIVDGCTTGSYIELPCGVWVIFESEKIIFSKNAPNEKNYEYKVNLQEKLTVIETGITYEFEVLNNLNQNYKNNHSIYLDLTDVDTDKIFLRTKKDGDIFYPSGMIGKKKVKKFYIDKKISKKERNKYPLLILNDEVAAIMPLRVSNKYIVNENTKKVLKININ